MGNTRVIVAMLLLIVGATFIAACGGDDDDDGGGASATATTDSSGSTSTTSAGGGATTAAAAATTPAAAGTQPATGEVTAADTCALLTKAEVEEALGEAILEPELGAAFDTPMPGGATASVGTCGYTAESFISSISLTYYYIAGDDDSVVQALIDQACGQGQESISGLGDRACWYDDLHAQIQLASNGNFIDIFATTSGDASEVLLTLAEKAANRAS